MSYFDPSIYSIDNLRDDDKRAVKNIDSFAEEVLTDDIRDEFIESKKITGFYTQSLIRETLSEFINFLLEQTEYYKCDMIINSIESYPEDEFEKLKSKAEKERILNAKKSKNKVDE